jgi:hypothetical protein
MGGAVKVYHLVQAITNEIQYVSNTKTFHLKFIFSRQRASEEQPICGQINKVSGAGKGQKVINLTILPVDSDNT